MTLKDPITIGPTSRILECSSENTRNLERAGQLRCVRLGRIRLFERSEVVALAKRRRRAARARAAIRK